VPTGAQAEEAAKKRVLRASETKLAALRKDVERARALERDAEAKTRAAKDAAAAETRHRIAAEEKKALSVREAAAPLRQLRDEQIASVEAAARQKIDAIDARFAKQDADKQRIRDATYIALAFAAVDGALLAGDRLHLGGPAALVGAALGVAAMIIYGTA